MNTNCRTLFFILIITMMASCGGGDSSTDSKTNYNKQTITEGQIKYIKLEDAKSFLPSWSKNNVLIYHTTYHPDDMHPVNGNSALKTEIMSYTQMYLIATDYQNLAVRPSAVKALPKVSENGKEFTYELRNDIKWDDGSPLTVEDVIFTYKANKCPLVNNPFAKPELDNIVDIQADKSNPNLFTVYMKREYIQNITCLSDFPIMQRTFFDKNNVLSKYTFAQLDDKKFPSF